MPEIVIAGGWRLIARQVQYTLIDGPDGCVDSLTRFSAFDTQRNLGILTRIDLLGRIQADIQQPVAGIDACRCKAQCPHWRVTGAFANRTDCADSDVNARAPFIRHRQFNRIHAL